MSFNGLLLYVAVMIAVICQAHALPPALVDSNDLDWVGNSPGDPLDPSFVGESMSMPLDADLIIKARKAGIIKESNPLYRTVRQLAPSDYVSLGTPPAGVEFADQPEDEAKPESNVTGPWSLDLRDRVRRHLDLALVQSSDAIMGYGLLTSENDSCRVAASGSQSGGRLSLTVMPVDRLDLYKLDLSKDAHTQGTYTACSSDGDTWSGEITGTAPPGI
jgi:hypothetical protein